MKLKQIPEDFQVEEMSDFQYDGGTYAVYRMEKRSIGTIEAIQTICKRWTINRKRINVGGLKDRYAVTKQFVTILRGQKRNFRQTNLTLTYLGQSNDPFKSTDIIGNRFLIAIRDLSDAQCAAMISALVDLHKDGVPNYFDAQRFGSLGDSGEFIAKPWCEGNYDRSLWLMLADSNQKDRPRERKIKSQLRQNWGKWGELAEDTKGTEMHPPIAHLAQRPNDFPGAITKVSPDLRSLYLAAYQSHLWNEILSEYLRRELPAEQQIEVNLQSNKVVFQRSLDATQSEKLKQLQIPLPSARLHLEPSPMLDLINMTLAKQGTELRALRVKTPRDSFFSKGERSALIQPNALAQKTADDEMYNGKKKLLLRFELPRAAYATMLLKRLQSMVKQNV